MSKAAKEDRIEELKAEIEDLQDNYEGYVEQYKNDIQDNRNDLKRLNKELAKLQAKKQTEVAAEPTPAAAKTETPQEDKATEKEVETLLEPIGKTPQERENQIFQFFALAAAGGDKTKAREIARVTNNLWENVAKQLGKRSKQAAEAWIQAKVALIGKTSVAGAKDRGNAKFQDAATQKWDGESNFNRWKGSNTLLDGGEIQSEKTGQPIVVRVYHGTTNDFYEFDSSGKGNIDGHLGKINYFTSDSTDAEQNYQSDGADITKRIETVAERIADQLYEEYADSDNDNKLDYRRVSKDFGIPLKEIKGIEDFLEIGRIIGKRRLQGGVEKVLDVYVKLNNPVVLGNGEAWIDLTDMTQFEDYIEDAAAEIAEENDISLEEAKEDYQ